METNSLIVWRTKVPVTSHERFWEAIESWSAVPPTLLSNTLNDLNNNITLSNGRKSSLLSKLNDAFDISKALIVFERADLKDDLTLRILKARTLNHLAIDDRLAILISGWENTSNAPARTRRVIVGTPFPDKLREFLNHLRNDLGALGGQVSPGDILPGTRIKDLDLMLFSHMDLSNQLKDACRRWSRREVSSVSDKLEDVWLKTRLPYDRQAKKQLKATFGASFPSSTLTLGDLDVIATVRELEVFT